jgi:post-segregation antitoxin (ccd killing protein)
MRSTFTIDDDLAEEARRYGVPLSAAAREGIATAVRHAKEQHDRAAYIAHPESADNWTPLEAWDDDAGSDA